MTVQQTKRLGPSERPWIESTVRPGDANAYHGLRDSDAAAMVVRTTGWIYYAASVNASATVGVPLRLYRPKASSSAQKSMSQERREAVYDWDARPVSRKQAEWLRRPGRVGPGRKAVQFAESTDDIEEITEHPLLDLLEHGNRFDDGGEVQELLEFFTEITGNGYANVVLDGSTGYPAQLFPMMSHWTKIVPDVREFVAGYYYGANGGMEEFFDRDEVIHFKHRMDFRDAYYGTSWVSQVAVEADTYAAARQDELCRWDNEERIANVVTIDGRVDDTIRNQIQAALRMHRGVGRSGKTAILGGEGIKFQPTGYAPKEMQYIEGLDNLRDMILMVAGVPKSKATTDDVNRANADAGEAQHARDTVLPRAVSRCKTLNSELVPLYGIELGDMWLAPDNPVPEDRVAKREENVAYVGSGIITINEARIEEGKEPIEGGDILRVNGVPLDEVGSQAASPFFGLSAAKSAEMVEETPSLSEQTNLIAGLLKLVAEGVLTREGAADLIEAQTTFTREQALAMIPEKPPAPTEPTGEQHPSSDDEDPAPQGPGGGDDDEEGEPGSKCCGDMDQLEVWTKAALQDDDAVGATASGEFRGALEDFFRKQTNAIARTVRKGLVDGEFSLSQVPLQKALGVKADVDEPWSKALLDVLRRHALSVFGDGGEFGRGEVERLLADDGREGPEGGISFDIESPEVRRFLANYTVELSKAAAEINTTTEQRVSRLIREGVERSLNTRQIAETIVESNRQISRDRATMIARTETARAFGEGRSAQWASTGQVAGKRWVLSADACEFCRAVAKNNPVVGIDEAFVPKGTVVSGTAGGKFNANYSDVRSEPLHPGCRCTTSAVLVEIGGDG